MPRPNLLIVVSDTLRADALDCTDDAARTPQLCGLAERGVFFERAYSNGPWTLPSSVSMFTGNVASAYLQRADAPELPDDFLYIADRELLLAEALAAEGYDVVSFLETSIAAEPNTFQGFTQRETGPPNYPVREGLLPELRQSDPRYRQMLGLLHYLLVAGDRSFFALQWIHDPHAVYLPPQHLFEQLTIDASRLTYPIPHYLSLGHQEDADRGYRKLRDHQQELSEYDVEFLEALYLKEVESVDERVGYVLDALERSGLAERTFVVFTSDHGEAFGEHGHFLHGGVFYEELVRVPLIIAGPGLPRGRRVEQAVSHVDLMPTLRDLMGVECLGDPQGASFEALLRGERDPAAARRQYLVDPTSRLEQRDALVEGGWKLIAFRDGRRLELYDLRGDPGERHDVAAAHPELAARMQAEIARLRTDSELRRERNRQLTNEDQLRRAGEETRAHLRALGYLD
ncbi:MAG: sulfatase [Myxococcota bacterium]